MIFLHPKFHLLGSLAKKKTPLLQILAVTVASFVDVEALLGGFKKATRGGTTIGCTTSVLDVQCFREGGSWRGFCLLGPLKGVTWRKIRAKKPYHMVMYDDIFCLKSRAS